MSILYEYCNIVILYSKIPKVLPSQINAFQICTSKNIESPPKKLLITLLIRATSN